MNITLPPLIPTPGPHPPTPTDPPTPLQIFSPDGMGLAGFDSLTGSPRTATESLAGEQSSVSGAVLSPQVGADRADLRCLGCPG